MLGPQDFQKIHKEMCEMSNTYSKDLINPDGSLKKVGVEIDHELTIQSRYLAGKMKSEDDRKAYAAWLVAKSKARQKTFDIPTAKEGEGISQGHKAMGCASYWASAFEYDISGVKDTSGRNTGGKEDDVVRVDEELNGKFGRVAWGRRRRRQR